DDGGRKDLGKPHGQQPRNGVLPAARRIADDEANRAVELHRLGRRRNQKGRQSQRYEYGNDMLHRLASFVPHPKRHAGVVRRALLPPAAAEGWSSPVSGSTTAP